MLKNAPIIFQLRDVNGLRDQRLAFVLFGILVLVTMVTLWLIFPISFEMLGKIDWSAVWKKTLNNPDALVELVLRGVVPVVALVGLFAHKRNARLTLDNDELRYTSGIPLIGRWLDWCLDLKAIRSNTLSFKLAGTPMGAQPMHLYRLTWGTGFNDLKQLRPSAWHLSDQAPPELIKPRSFLGLVRWGTPENMLILQQQFNQLPLMQALRQRGIVVPPITGKKQHTGVDLMAFPRFKAVVIGFFVALAVALALFHTMRHQHYFVQPAWAVWIVVAGLCGLAAYLWLRLEPAGQDRADYSGGTLEFRFTQIFLACLVGLAAGVCAPFLPLALSNMAQPAQEVAFILQKSPLLLRAPTSGEMPDIQPAQALDYWASLPEGTVIKLPVRRGNDGLWWQFDSSVLGDKLDVFYATQRRRE